MKAYFFTAYYCNYCKIAWDEVMEPLIDEGFQIEEVDAMKHPAMADRYGIKSIPTTVIVQGNTPSIKIQGKVSKGQLRSLLLNEVQD